MPTIDELARRYASLMQHKPTAADSTEQYATWAEEASGVMLDAALYQESQGESPELLAALASVLELMSEIVDPDGE